MNDAEACGQHMHGALGGIAGALMVGMAASRVQSVQRQARVARCAAAGSAAAANVHAASAAVLRERLADAEDDYAVLHEEHLRVRSQLDALCAWVAAGRASGRIAG